MSDIVVCIHGLEHDACEYCRKRDVDVVKEEAIVANSDFSWRSPINIGEVEAGERDNAYDIEVELDAYDGE